MNWGNGEHSCKRLRGLGLNEDCFRTLKVDILDDLRGNSVRGLHVGWGFVLR